MSRSIPLVVDHGASHPTAAHAAAAHLHSIEKRQAPPGSAPVYLRVADVEISEAEVAHEMQHHRAASPHQSRADAARALVVRALLLLEVKRLQLLDEVTPMDGETMEEASIRVLLDREAPTPEPDAQACQRYFDSNRARLRHPDRFQTRHILFAAAPDDAPGRARGSKEGEKLIGELRQNPERFTEYAQRFSDCPSKDQGGELGWIERGQTTPEFERQLFMLRPGLAGLTIESRWGHHVVCVDAIERGEALSFDEARDKIAAYLETQVKQNAIHQYLQILRERHGVQGLDEIEAAV